MISRKKRGFMFEGLTAWGCWTQQLIKGQADDYHIREYFFYISDFGDVRNFAVSSSH